MASNTKDTILQAYFNLITQKNIDKVTVKDVVEVCGITRQTFYYHFQDLLDVVEFGFRQRLEACIHQGLEAENIQEALRIYLSYTDRYRILARKLINSQKKQQICDLVLISIQDWLFEMFREKYSNGEYPVHETDFAIHFYAYAISGSLYDIIWNDEPDLDFIVTQTTKLPEPVFGSSAS